MDDKYLKNITFKRGRIKNLDDVISSFDEPSYQDDILLIKDEEILSFNSNSGNITFKNGNESETKIIDELKDSGFIKFLSQELNEKEIPLSIAIMSLQEKSTHSASVFFKNENNQNEDTSLMSFVSNLVKNQDTKRAERLEKHRHSLKSKSAKKTKRIKP